MISKKSLQKFIDNYRSQYGVELNEKEAVVIATKTLKLYRAFFGDPLLDLLKKQNNDR